MKKLLPLFVALTLCFTTSGLTTQAMAEETLAKPSPKVQKLIDKFQLQVVDFDYVSKAIGKGTRKGAPALLIDARPNVKYIKGTIPSSINLPDTNFDEFFPQIETADKDREVIVFCGGWKCGKSPKVANMLMEKGFTDVKLYQAGEPEWAKNTYSEIGTAVIKSAQEKNSALIVDARPFKKYLQATIPGAISIPDTQMDDLEGRFPANKDEKIITFCGGYDCGKSHKVAKKLLSLGYANVSVYAGGMPLWKDDGLATTGGGATNVVDREPQEAITKNGIKLGVDEGTVDGEWFNGLIFNNTVPANVQIVDVVPAEDFASGHLDGAINIQAEELSAQELAAMLPKDKIVVFNCTSGARALEAWTKLKEANIDVASIYYFDANISCEKGSQCKIEVNEPLG